MLGQTKISSFFTSPTSNNKKRSLEEAGNNSTSPKSKCQKSEEVDDTRSTSSLSPEQRERMERKRLEALERLSSRKGPAHLGMSWKKALSTEFEKDYFVKLNTFVESERKNKTVYPPGEEVFTWTKQCDIHEVKVVILGQDPYHGPRQAHGLCFSVKPGVAIPPSLVNIYKELESDIDGFRNPMHGYLIGWARQGVLLLNAVLTVVASQANSHKDKGWEKFTDAVIRWINTNLTGVVFMLWGAYAQKKGSFIDKNKHCVLKAVHPSPLSAHRGFLGCKHFSQANDYLKKKGKKAIDWTDLPLE